MSDASDRALRIATDLLDGITDPPYADSHMLAALTLAVLHAADEIRRLAGEQQAVGDEVSRLADAVQQHLKPPKGI